MNTIDSVITPEEAIERIRARFGVHPGARVLHAKGVICSGSFRPTPEAAALTRAAHMRGEVAVLARLSNGGGDPGIPDRAPDVRGLAVSFELPDDSRTDVLAQSAPRFPVRTPEAFVELVEATARGPAMAWRLPRLIARHPSVATALRANAAALRAPSSFGDLTYHAIHAFRWTGADGSARWVRYRWLPSGDGPSPPEEPEGGDHLGNDHLIGELEARLPDRPLRFFLELQIADPSDDPHDPTAVWPASRPRLRAGTLELDALAPGRDQMIFDPLRLTDGIAPSEDPILHFRSRAYSVSYDLRTGSRHERPPWARDQRD